MGPSVSGSIKAVSYECLETLERWDSSQHAISSSIDTQPGCYRYGAVTPTQVVRQATVFTLKDRVLKCNELVNQLNILLKHDWETGLQACMNVRCVMLRARGGGACYAGNVPNSTWCAPGTRRKLFQRVFITI